MSAWTWSCPDSNILNCLRVPGGKTLWFPNCNPKHKRVKVEIYVAILCLGIAIVTLALLIHVDSYLESSHLAPIIRHQVSVTPQGLEEMEHTPESHENQGITSEGNILSEIPKEPIANSEHVKETKIL